MIAKPNEECEVLLFGNLADERPCGFLSFDALGRFDVERGGNGNRDGLGRAGV